MWSRNEFCTLQCAALFQVQQYAYEFISSFEYSDAMHICLNNMSMYNKQKAFNASPGCLL